MGSYLKQERGARPIASNSKAIGGQQCHHSGPWSSALSGALCPALSFLYPDFIQQRCRLVLLGSGDSEVVP